MATTRASGYVVTHTVWNDVLSGLTDNGQTYSGAFAGSTVAGTTLSMTGFSSGHGWSASGTGLNAVSVRNTSTVSGDGAAVSLGSGATDAVSLLHYADAATGYTGPYARKALLLKTDSNCHGGCAVNIESTNANASFRVYVSGGATPAFSVDYLGVVSATAYGTHAFSAGGAAGNELRVRNTTGTAAAFASLTLGNDNTATGAYLYLTSTGYTPSGRIVADGLHLETSRAGGISIAAVNAAGDVRIYAGGSSTAFLTIADAGQVTAPSQSGVFAYNSADDTSQASGATVDVNTEVYDIGNNFATDTWTAPVTGYYLVIAAARITNTEAQSDPFWLAVTGGGVIYRGPSSVIGASETLTVGVSAVVYLTSSQTAAVTAHNLSGTGLFTVNGGTATDPETFVQVRLLS